MGWTDLARVKRAFGNATSVYDDPWLNDCIAAANAWAPRKRAEAGYVDDPDVAPSEDVAQGTTMYAVALVRERGSADSFASFEELSSFAQVGSMGQVKRLLGIGRAAVDKPPGAAAVAARRRRTVLR